MSMHNVVTVPFIVCAGIGALLNAIPLPKAIASGNVGTSMLIIWTEVACVLQLASAIRWNGNVENWAPVWCDFCGYFLVAVDIALVGASVSINRRLYMIVTLDPRIQEKAFNAVVDIVLCLVIPLASIGLEYVVQQYRYYIYEDVGCIPGVGAVNLSFPLVWMLPLLIGTISVGYAYFTVRANFQQNYNTMGETRRSLAWSRRLTTVGVISSLYALVPTSAAIALIAVTYPVAPWPGWKAIHSTIDDVVYVPAREWRSNSTWIACIELKRWTTVSLTFVIFLFLGLPSDARKTYRVPPRGIDNQASSGDQTGAAPGRDVDEESPNDHWEGAETFYWVPCYSNDLYIPFEEAVAGRRRASISSANGSRLDSDLETIELALPPHNPVAEAV